MKFRPIDIQFLRLIYELERKNLCATAYRAQQIIPGLNITKDDIRYWCVPIFRH